jgi:hypothetical protein
MLRQIFLPIRRLLTLCVGVVVVSGCSHDPQEAVESNYIRAIENAIEDERLCLDERGSFMSGKLSGEPFVEHAASRWPMWDELVKAGMFEKQEIKGPVKYRGRFFDRGMTIPVRVFKYSLSEPFKRFVAKRAGFSLTSATQICVAKMKFESLVSVDGPKRIPLGFSVVQATFVLVPDQLPEEILSHQEIFRRFFPELFDGSKKRTQELPLILTHSGWKAKKLITDDSEIVFTKGS